MSKGYLLSERSNGLTASLKYVGTEGAINFDLPTDPTVVDIPVKGGVIVVEGVNYTVTEVSIERAEGKFLSRTYDVAASASVAPSGTPGVEPKPWELKSLVEVGSSGRQRIVLRDLDGRPVLNSAKQRPVERLEVPTADTLITVRRARNIDVNAMVARSTAFNNKINSSSVTLFGVTYPEKTLLLKYQASSRLLGTEVYAEETITVEQNSETWISSLMDEGSQMIGIKTGPSDFHGRAEKRAYRLPSRGGNVVNNPTSGIPEVPYPDAWVGTDSQKCHAEGAGVAKWYLLKGATWNFRETPFLLNGAGRPLTGSDPVTGVAPANQPSQDEAYNANNTENVPNVDTDKSSAEAVFLKFRIFGLTDFSSLDIDGNT